MAVAKQTPPGDPIGRACRRCQASPRPRHSQHRCRHRDGDDTRACRHRRARAGRRSLTPATRPDRIGACGSSRRTDALSRLTASRNTHRSRTWRPKKGHGVIRAERGSAVVRLCRYLDHVQRRPRHQVEADPGPSPRLWFSHDGIQRSCRADPPQGDAGDPDHGRRARRMDARPPGTRQRSCSGRCPTTRLRSSCAARKRKIGLQRRLGASRANERFRTALRIYCAQLYPRAALCAKPQGRSYRPIA
jgi:hypothetical protein